MGINKEGSPGAPPSGRSSATPTKSSIETLAAAAAAAAGEEGSNYSSLLDIGQVKYENIKTLLRNFSSEIETINFFSLIFDYFSRLMEYGIQEKKIATIFLVLVTSR